LVELRIGQSCIERDAVLEKVVGGFSRLMDRTPAGDIDHTAHLIDGYIHAIPFS
jgi:hypothetical protein